MWIMFFALFFKSIIGGKQSNLYKKLLMIMISIAIKKNKLT